MKNKMSGRSVWSSKRPFRFESKKSLEEVARALADLAKADEGDKISLHATDNGYSFQYRLQRSGTHTRHITASGEGQIWQDELGYIIVEGMASTASVSQYGKMGFVIALLTVAMFFITEDILVLFPLLPLASGIILILNYYRERDLLVEHIAHAIGQPFQPFIEKQTVKGIHHKKHQHTAPSRLSEDVSMLADSIWSEAISEYDDLTQDR